MDCRAACAEEGVQGELLVRQVGQTREQERRNSQGPWMRVRT